MKEKLKKLIDKVLEKIKNNGGRGLDKILDNLKPA